MPAGRALGILVASCALTLMLAGTWLAHSTTQGGEPSGDMGNFTVVAKYDFDLDGRPMLLAYHGPSDSLFVYLSGLAGQWISRISASAMKETGRWVLTSEGAGASCAMAMDTPNQVLWVAWDNVLACFDIVTERVATCAKPFLEDATLGVDGLAVLDGCAWVKWTDKSSILAYRLDQQGKILAASSLDLPPELGSLAVSGLVADDVLCNSATVDSAGRAWLALRSFYYVGYVGP